MARGPAARRGLAARVGNGPSATASARGAMTRWMPHLNHVGLTVTDLPTSIAFYTDVVGFALARPPVRVEGDWFDTLTHNSGAQLDAVTLDLDGFTLQLVQYHAGGGG